MLRALLTTKDTHLRRSETLCVNTKLAQYSNLVCMLKNIPKYLSMGQRSGRLKAIEPVDVVESDAALSQPCSPILRVVSGIPDVRVRYLPLRKPRVA